MRDNVLTEQVNAIQARILQELLRDGRKTTSEIAKKLGETRENVKKNLCKMEEMGIITGATIHINYRFFGYRAVAHILINVDSHQADQLIGYLQKMPEVYSLYSRWIKGNVDVVTILKTLEQLNDIKDTIKRHFSILEMKTAMWTDIKEMNDNLSIIQDDCANVEEALEHKINIQEKGNRQTVIVDEIDQKIADKLAENGRISMEALAGEIGITADMTKRRYEKLKKNRVLKVTIQVNPTKIGYQALCVFFTTTSNEMSFATIEKISEIPDIISIMKTTGDYDLQIWAMIKDIPQLLSIQEKLGKVQGILRMDMEILSVLDNWPTPRQCISTF